MSEPAMDANEAASQQAKDPSEEQGPDLKEKVAQAVDDIEDRMEEAGESLGKWLTRARRVVATRITRGSRVVKDQAGQVKETVSGVAGEVAEAASEVAGDIKKDASTAAREVADQFKRGADRLINVKLVIAKKYMHLAGKIAMDPEREKPGLVADKVRGLVKDLGPVIGPHIMYLDARAKYQHALSTGNEEKLHEARRECLIACVDLATDAFTVGLARVFGRAGKRFARISKMGRLVKQISALKIIRKLPSVDIQMSDKKADKMLKDTMISGVMDSLLLWDPSEIKEGTDTSLDSES